MAALLGPPPPKFLKRSKNCEQYWDNQGIVLAVPSLHPLHWQVIGRKLERLHFRSPTNPLKAVKCCLRATIRCSFYGSYAENYAGYRRRGPLRGSWLSTTFWCKSDQTRGALQQVCSCRRYLGSFGLLTSHVAWGWWHKEIPEWLPTEQWEPCHLSWLPCLSALDDEERERAHARTPLLYLKMNFPPGGARGCSL